MAANADIPARQHASGLDLPRREKMEILFAILLALFLGALDQTVVGTALPRVVTDLGGNDYYTWVVTIYLLTSTITVPFYGKLSDLLGRKPLLLFGITVFLIGSALSGLSQTMWELILFRGIQGIGAGSLFPIALAVIGDLFTPAERGRYQGLFGAVFGISFLVGPAIGGILTDVVSWHWVFYVNLPIGLVSLLVVWRLLPNIKRPDLRHAIDYVGAAVFTVAISLLLIGLTNKQTGDWTDPPVGGLIAAAVVIGAIFVFIESRAAEPIVPLGLFRISAYSTSIAATFLVSFGFFGAVIFIPRWFQVVRGFGATESGYQMFPLLLGLIASSIISGQMIARTGKYKAIIVGAITIMTVGIFLLTHLTASQDLPTFYLEMFVTGIGIGPTMAAFTIVVQNAVPFDKLGVATSNLTFFRQIGGSIGLAIAGTVFGQSLREQLTGQVVPVINTMKAAVPTSQLPAAFQPPFTAGLDGLKQAFSGAGGGAGSVDLNTFAGVGQSLGRGLADRFAAQAPAAAKPVIDGFFGPFIPQIDHAFYNAFSLAVGQTFQIAVVTTGLAIVAALAMRELPLRKTFGPAPQAAGAGVTGEAEIPAPMAAMH
jgi:EmrB/QacA subfamily drug resistance transporter